MEAKNESDLCESVTDHETNEGPSRWRASFFLITVCLCDGRVTEKHMNSEARCGMPVG